MQILRLIVVALVVFSTAFIAQAAPSDTYSFSDPVTEKRYRELVKELRCPKCQNQNLADSNSQIAIDLRNEVYRMLKEGKSDGEITNYMVDRYGEFVLYRPRVGSLTYILWFGPVLLILVGITVVILMVRRKSLEAKDIALSEQQKQQLDNILTDKNKS